MAKGPFLFAKRNGPNGKFFAKGNGPNAKKERQIMLENLKKEMNNFFKDLDENIKDKEELLYVKKRKSDLVDFMAGEIEKIMN